MRTLLFAALAGASLLASAAAFADDAKPVTPTPAAATDDPNKPICHPVTHEGQLVGKTCHTQKEWDQIQFHTQQELRQYQQQSLYGSQH
jgi:Spy/CpxP family protein refolding chaperone